MRRGPPEGGSDEDFRIGTGKRSRVNILQNYILKEIIVGFLLAILLFTFVLLVGNLVKLVELVMTKGVHLLSVLKLFAYLMPSLLNFTIPMSLLTSTVLVFGRLSADGEITAMRASGIRLFKLSFPVIVFGLLLSLGSLALSDQFLPKTHFAYRKLLKEIGVKNPTSILEAGTFIEGFGNYILFIYEIDNGLLKNIRIYQPQENRPPRTIVARTGRILTSPGSDVITIKLTDGTSDEPNPQKPETFYKLNFRTYLINLKLSSALKEGTFSKKPKDMTITELRHQIKKYRKEKIDPAPFTTEIHKKLSMAFSSLVFVLVGLPLSVRTGRKELSINFAISMAVAFVYWIFLALGEALSLRGLLDPSFNMWLPNLLLSAVGIFLIMHILEGRS